MTDLPLRERGSASIVRVAAAHVIRRTPHLYSGKPTRQPERTTPYAPHISGRLPQRAHSGVMTGALMAMNSVEPCIRCPTGILAPTPTVSECADTRAAGRVGETARCSRCRVYLTISPADAEITGAGLEWTVAMISELSMPCR
jgi:hypothetical protein